MTDLEWIRQDAEEALQSVETDPVAAAKQLADCVVRLTHVIEGMRQRQDVREDAGHYGPLAPMA